jgi:hypothetical protein
MTFNQAEREFIGQLADVLIPAGSGMYSASAAGVADQWLDKVLEARPDLTVGLTSLLSKVAGGEPCAVVSQLRSNDPATFGILAEIAAGAYFMNPDVQRAIGYAGQNQRPIEPEPDYLQDGLLESVIRRGPIYRPTPDTTQ